jgi:hypothetical protein
MALVSIGEHDMAVETIATETHYENHTQRC